jgi:hypothetical protein
MPATIIKACTALRRLYCFTLTVWAVAFRLKGNSGYLSGER